MSVRVNLLPREVEERSRGRRVSIAIGVGLGLWIVLLGLLYVLKLGDINAARDQREAAQAEVDRLRVELADLEQYRRLAAAVEIRNGMLAAAMEDEISWSRVFNDLSLSFPANSSLLTLVAQATEPVAAEAAAPPAPTEGATPGAATPGAAAPGAVQIAPAAATVTFTGYSVERYAPGVESVLLEFDSVRAFFNAYLTNAAKGRIGTTEVTNFAGSVQLNEEAFTRRYVDGLPVEVTP